MSLNPFNQVIGFYIYMGIKSLALVKRLNPFNQVIGFYKESLVLVWLYNRYCLNPFNQVIGFYGHVLQLGQRRMVGVLIPLIRSLVFMLLLETERQQRISGLNPFNQVIGFYSLMKLLE